MILDYNNFRNARQTLVEFAAVVTPEQAAEAVEQVVTSLGGTIVNRLTQTWKIDIPGCSPADKPAIIEMVKEQLKGK